MPMRLSGARARVTSEQTTAAFLWLLARRSTAQERARRTRYGYGAALREIRGVRDQLLAEAAARLKERFHAR